MCNPPNASPAVSQHAPRKNAQECRRPRPQDPPTRRTFRGLRRPEPGQGLLLCSAATAAKPIPKQSRCLELEAPIGREVLSARHWPPTT